MMGCDMLPKIIPNNWLQNNRQFFRSIANIQEASEEVDGYGQVVRTWSDVDALKGLPCSIAPISVGSPQKQEDRQVDITSTERTWHVTIRGHYVNLINDTQRVQIFKIREDGDSEHLLNLNIIGVEQDSHSVMTRLRCEVFSYDGEKHHD